MLIAFSARRSMIKVSKTGHAYIVCVSLIHHVVLVVFDALASSESSPQMMVLLHACVVARNKGTKETQT